MKKLHICKVKVVSEFSDAYSKLPENNDCQSETLENNDCLEDICSESNMYNSESNTHNSENITLEIVPVKKTIITYDNHYISIIMLYTFDTYDTIDTIEMMYIIGNSTLCINNKIVPTYKIEYENGYKFKKFIRDKVLNEFNFKNKDIISIKNINTNENYHNYLVLLNGNKRNSQYKNSALEIDKINYTWSSKLELYEPKNINPEKTEIYLDLSMNYKQEFYFSDETKCNNIDIKDVYKSISYVI